MFDDFKSLFTPYEKNSTDILNYSRKKDLLINQVVFFDNETNLQDIEKFDIAIMGIPEDRNSQFNKGSAYAPDYIRKELYKLYRAGKRKIIDLGNFIPGKTIKDTYSGVSDIVLELLKNEIIVLIMGGSNDLLIPVTNAYKNGNKSFTLCTSEPRLSFDDDDLVCSESYLSEIMKNNKKMNHYINLGYQTYYNSPDIIKYISDKYEALRLGISSSDITLNEPFIRDSDIFGIHIESVRLSDAPATQRPSVNGFYAEDICQLARYAGLSEKISTFCLFDVNPAYDEKNKTAALSAQIMWYFIQSVSERKNEIPSTAVKKFLKYNVNVEGVNDGIVFYKSPKTERWWLQINYVVNNDERTKIISCTQDDFIKASKNEIPERWWKFYQKLNKLR